MNVKDRINFIDRTDVVNRYLDEIRKYDVLKPEEEAELFRRISDGDDNAKKKIIESNQRFVFSVAKSYGGRGKLMDLVNEGNIGLIKAIDTFDVTKGYKFISYAVWYIRREINMFLMNDGQMVRKSNISKTYNKVTNIKNKFFAENGRFPSNEEVSDILEAKYGIQIKNDIDLCDLNYSYLSSSIDGDSVYEDSREFSNATSYENDYNSKSDKSYDKAIVLSLLKRLSEREKKIIMMSFGIGYDREYSNIEIAKEVGLTSERVRQIRISVIDSFKNKSERIISKAI